MHNWKRFLGVIAGTVLCVNVVTQKAGASTIYPINLTVTSSNPTGNPAQSDTLSGSITTDGTIGTLAPADILGWNLNLTDNLNSAYDFDLTTANSSLVEDTGNALSATASGLYFNFSGNGEFLIQANNPGSFSGYHYFCLSTGGACLAGESIVPDYIDVDGVVLTGSAAPIGQQPLNSGSATPEPAEYGLLSIGLLLSAVGVKRTVAKASANS